MFKKIIGVNGALNATLTQADEIKKFAKIIFNKYGKNYDLIHSHGCFPLTYHMMKKATKLKKPILISAHQTHYDTDNAFIFSKQISQLFKIYLRSYFKFADLVVCPTEYSKRIVRTELRFDKYIKLISNGVNTQVFKHSSKKRTHFRKNFNLNSTTVLCVGMPIERKGFYDFIKISREMNKYPFLWVGKRAFPIIQQNLNYNINNLIMPGYVEDIISAYSAGDIFCFPSYYEGEGIAILEAMSCGLPVVIRDLPTYEGRFINGENCLKARNNKEFINKIYYLINHPEESKRIANNGLNTAKKLDIKKTAKSIYETYLELMHM
ncbi:MAG: glycosyltransferase family 4 protein [Candidatus Hermodarchaeota archaeon]